MNHRDAGAFERFAPTQKAFEQAQKMDSVQPKSSVEKTDKPQKAQPEPGEVSLDDVLVVVSKVKGYIRERSGMNTSDSVMDLLSQRVRRFADQAIDSAQRNGRKTVLDRDIS